jgi:hypothetical protein
MDETIDEKSVHAELERARVTFHSLVETARPETLQRLSDRTRWTNQQLLFHMLFGYLVVQRLLPLVRLFGHLPAGYSRRFSAVLNALTVPYDRINYLGSCGGALVFKGPRLLRKFDRTIAALHARLDRETGQALGRRMHFPVRWDPFFTDTMTLLDVYHFGTQHFDFHRSQLTLD